jgi:hypothetical protein
LTRIKSNNIGPAAARDCRFAAPAASDAPAISERVNLFPGSKYRFGLHGSKSGDSLFLAIR